MKNNKILTVLFVLSVFIQNGADADLATGILNNIMIDENPEWNNRVEEQGREYKAEEAEKDSKTGKGVALATGIALIATGSAMIPSPEISVSIAGVTLVTKGIIELAQSGADAGTEGANRGQKDLLLDAGGDLGDELSKNGQGLYIPDDLRNAISNLGADPDAVAQAALSGDTDSVFPLFGLDPSTFSNEDRAEAASLENGQLDSLFSAQAASGEEQGIKLTVDENLSDEAPGNTNVIARGLGPNSSAGEKNGDLSARGADGGALDSGRGLASAAGASVGASGNGTSGGVDMSQLLGGLKGKDKDPLAGFTQAQLLEMGIRKKQRGQNIFKVAGYHFRRFDGWRKGRSVKKVKNLSATKVSFKR